MRSVRICAQASRIPARRCRYAQLARVTVEHYREAVDDGSDVHVVRLGQRHEANSVFNQSANGGPGDSPLISSPFEGSVMRWSSISGGRCGCSVCLGVATSAHFPVCGRASDYNGANSDLLALELAARCR